VVLVARCARSCGPYFVSARQPSAPSSPTPRWSIQATAVRQNTPWLAPGFKCEAAANPGVHTVLGRADDEAGPAVDLGAYRAVDGSSGARVGLDCDRPHVGLVVGKRGYGKSYTLGVLAEGLSRADGVAPVVVDPVGVFAGLADGDVPARVVERPRVAADALPPRAWCETLDLDPTDPAGTLVWRAAEEAGDLDGMRAAAADASADAAARRAAANHLDLAASWGVFDPAGLTAPDLADDAVAVLDVSGLPDAAAAVVVRAVATALYEARVADRLGRLPWLLVDEAHAFLDGVAAPALERLATRGRHPGVGLVAATQRPGAVPSTVVSQADTLVAHRLTAAEDRAALSAAEQSYLDRSLVERLPTTPGEARVVDDATESVHAVRIRERDTPHGGATPRASDISSTEN
jgi:hypothetical protein